MVASLLLAAVLAGPRIHSLCDISHEFSFYMDGRFHRQYIGDAGVDARNWGTLWKADLTDVNLLVLPGGDPHVPFDPRSVAAVRKFVTEGGGLVLMGDGRGGPPPVQRVADAFKIVFDPTPAKLPVKRPTGEDAEFRGGGTLAAGDGWTVLAADADGKPVLARRDFGKGQVLAGVRGLFGSNPDASDPINAAWISPILQSLVRGKPVDPSRPPKEQWAELTETVGPLTVEYHEGTRVFAEAIGKEYAVVRPLLVDVTGVEPSPGMITRLLMLPTGSGGFSSGERIAIGAWWGDYPKNRYPMIELISHEAGHSWVLPHPEPIWNEPIATYLGILVGKKLGLPEAQTTLDRTIAAGRKLDPDFTKVDIAQAGAPRDAVWGKSFYFFEQMEAKYGPGAIAKYFRAKRRLVAPGRGAYTLADCVEVWSQAVGEDVSPWFHEHGITL